LSFGISDLYSRQCPASTAILSCFGPKEVSFFRENAALA
jgi:hypothetical protein